MSSSSPQKSKLIAAPLSHSTISSENKTRKHSLRHRLQGYDIFLTRVLKQTSQVALALFFVLSVVCHSSVAIDDTIYLYDDDLYDSVYYDEDYNSALTKYYKEEAKTVGQHQSGE